MVTCLYSRAVADSDVDFTVEFGADNTNLAESVFSDSSFAGLAVNIKPSLVLASAKTRCGAWLEC